MSIPFLGGDYIGKMSPPVVEVVWFGLLPATVPAGRQKKEMRESLISYRRKSVLIYDYSKFLLSF
jgi:hypothetical protein